MASKTVMITGCSTGFGRLTAKTFHDKGWQVIATMRSPEKEAELAALDGVWVARLDVTDKASIHAAVGAGLARFGALDVVVNNAARGGRVLLEASSDERVRGMFDTDVFGVIDVCRSLIPHMRARKPGCVINVISTAGMIGLPLETSYSGTKYAVEGMTEALAFELKGLGILAKTLTPGVYSQADFSANVDDDDWGAAGDELTAYRGRLREHFRGSVSAEGGPVADPQVVADKIYECATAKTPIHNLVGSDAQRLIRMIDWPQAPGLPRPGRATAACASLMARWVVPSMARPRLPFRIRPDRRGIPLPKGDRARGGPVERSTLGSKRRVPCSSRSEIPLPGSER